MKNMTIELINRALDVKLPPSFAPECGHLTDVITDSRKVSPGCLFAAIKGERSDGHDYIASAFSKGASVCIGERIPDGLSEDEKKRLIIVPDTVSALGSLSKAYRECFNIPVVAVTGSVGKTTTKELICSVLSRRYRVHKTAGNFNNDLGVPLTLFGLREEHEIAVVELGVSHFGDMDRIASKALPDSAVFTNIGDAHLEFLEDREGVFREKGRVMAYLSGRGRVFACGDDAILARLCERSDAVLYGLGDNCSLRAENIRLSGESGSAFDIVSEEKSFKAMTNAFGDHLILAALSAAAVGIFYGLSEEEIAAGIADYTPTGSRARLIKCGDVTVIDDCYNANPTSVSSSVSSLSKLEGRKICILGDMLELGKNEAELHRDMGLLCRRLNIDMVLTVGRLSENTAEAFGGSSFSSNEELIKKLPELLLPGDNVLVKASHSMRFEEITKAIEKMYEG